MTAVMLLAEVTKTYPGSPPVQALMSVSMSICAGERLAVLGPSGSGKTTLLHVLGTLERPTSGAVWIGGQEVSALSDAGFRRFAHIGWASCSRTSTSSIT